MSEVPLYLPQCHLGLVMRLEREKQGLYTLPRQPPFANLISQNVFIH